MLALLQQTKQVVEALSTVLRLGLEMAEEQSPAVLRDLSNETEDTNEVNLLFCRRSPASCRRPEI